MNYDVIIITEADFSDDPAFVYPFKADKIEAFEVAVRGRLQNGDDTIPTKISWRPAARCWLRRRSLVVRHRS
jgi:hypothetical protein